MPQDIAQPMNLIHNWLTEHRAGKRAAEKSGGADATPGGDNTEPTTHPVMDDDPQTEPATEGARGKENESDVGEQVGGDPITGQEDANTASSAQPSDDMGTKTMDADEVKGNTEKPKAKKDPPDENGRGDASPNHPTSEEMRSQEKYSSVDFRKDIQLILEAFASGGIKEAQTAVKPAKKKAEEGEEVEIKGPGGTTIEVEKEGKEKEEEDEAEKKAAVEKYPDDYDNGFVAAAMLLEQMGIAKQANENESRLIEEHIAGVVSSARADADAACDYIEGFEKGAAAKRAAAEMPLPPELMQEMAGGGEAEVPAEEASEEAIEGAGEAGGMPGAEEAMAAEGAGEELGAGGEGGIDEEAIIQALAEAGVNPEELMAALEAEGGGEMAPETEKLAKAAQVKLQVAVNKRRLRAVLQS